MLLDFYGVHSCLSPDAAGEGRLGRWFGSFFFFFFWEKWSSCVCFLDPWWHVFLCRLLLRSFHVPGSFLRPWCFFYPLFVFFHICVPLSVFISLLSVCLYIPLFSVGLFFCYGVACRSVDLLPILCCCCVLSRGAALVLGLILTWFFSFACFLHVRTAFLVVFRRSSPPDAQGLRGLASILRVALTTRPLAGERH